MKKNKILVVIAFILSVTVLMACSDPDADNTSSNGTDNSETQAIGEVWYEAVFLNNEEIIALFKEVRGEQPYQHVTKDFHVTMAYLPEKDSRDLYGKEVTVKITGYKAGDVLTDEGGITQNEGFKVELISDDSDFKAYMDNHVANYHITGSYVDHAKYTGYLDFSDARPLDYTVQGRFGGCVQDGRIVFAASEVSRKD